MPFTREELAAYEKTAPATTTPAAEGTSTATATAPAASKQETPKPEGEDSSTDADPPAAEDSTDQTDSGDGVSSDDNADSSTADGDSDADTGTDDDAVVQEPAPKKGSAAERIRNLIEERDAWKRMSEHVLTEAQTRLANQNAATTSTAPAAPVDDAKDPKPTLESCGFDAAKFESELTAWHEQRIDRRVKQALSQETAAERFAAAANTFNEKATEFAKTKPDYKLVMSQKLPPVHEDTARNIVTADHGPEIAYHLAKNPDVAARLARGSRDQQLVMVGRLEERFANEGKTATTTKSNEAAKDQAKPKAKKPTQAPPPPTPRPASATTSKANVLDGSLNMTDWVAADRAQKAADRANRIKLRDSMRRH